MWLHAPPRRIGDDGLGIDLGEDGVTPNDDMDPDPGPNGLQNFPVITKAKRGQTTTKIKGTLNSAPNEPFTVEVFQADGKTRQGKIYLGGAGFTTNDDGNALLRSGVRQAQEGEVRDGDGHPHRRGRPGRDLGVRKAAQGEVGAHCRGREAALRFR